jgi:sugar phosphate isomerase/epimerase
MNGSRSRRQVLMAGASAMAASVLAGGHARAADTPAPAASDAAADKPDAPLPPVLKLSLAAYSFRQDLDKPGQPGRMSLLDLVDMCARLRIDAVEPTSYYFLSTDDAFLYNLKHRTFLAGLEISGTPVGNNFCHPAGADFDREVDHVRTWVDHCVKLGSPAIRIFAGRAHKDLSREQAFARTVEGMKRTTEYAASRGIFLTIENHGYLTETADDLLRLLDAVDNEWLGINLDTGNFREDPYGQIARAAPRSLTCQVKAMVRGPSGEQEPADFPRIVRILREARYRGYLALEYEGPDPHAQVPVCLQKLREAIQA